MTWRRICRHPVSSFIHIFSLGLGIACFTLMMLYVEDELSFDKKWNGSQNIYKVNMDMKLDNAGKETHYKRVYPMIAPFIRDNIEQAEFATRFQPLQYLLRYQDTAFYETIRFIDHDFFNIFDLEFIQGSPDDLKNNPYGLILTENMVEKYFGENSSYDSVINKVLSLDGNHQFTVVGVIKNITHNTVMDINLLANFSVLESIFKKATTNDWTAPSTITYTKLHTNVTPKSFEHSIKEKLKRHIPTSLHMAPVLQAVTDIHLSRSKTRLPIIQALTMISLLILLMSVINTVNLSTARGAERHKEFIVRKALGASRRQIFNQFIVEANMTAVFALWLSIILVEVSLPWFNTLINKDLSFHYFTNLTLFLKLIGICLLTGFLSGLYPAVIFSRNGMTNNIIENKGKNSRIRKSLIVIQCSIAISVALFSMVMFKQMNFLKNIDLGFDTEHIITIDKIQWTDMKPNYETMKKQLQQHPNIVSVSGSSAISGRNYSRKNAYYLSNKTESDATVFNILSTDYQFFTTYGIDLKAGRYFSQQYGQDRADTSAATQDNQQFNAIINYRAAIELGWQDASQAIGQTLRSTIKSPEINLSIIGVVDNFHIDAGHREITPSIYILDPGWINFMSIKLDRKNISDTLQYVSDVWLSLNPKYPIEYQFVNESITKRLLRLEKNMSLMWSLVIVALVIASLGLFSLSAFTVKLRAKEVCIRKVLGASNTDIARLFLADFSRLILIANIIAIPMAIYLTSSWLNKFAYSTDISFSLFLAVTIVSLIICWLAVSYHTLNIASANLGTEFKKNRI